MLNFSNFKPVATTNTRDNSHLANRGQNFEFKFREFESNKGGKSAIETQFTISDKKFEEFNLEEKGLRQFTDPDSKQTILGVVDNEDATILKRTDKLKEGSTKGKKFKATVLEDALVDMGILEKGLVGKTQTFKLTKIADETQLGNIKAYAILEITKSGDAHTEEGDDENNSVETSQEPVASNPVEEVQGMNPSQAQDDDDNF